MKKFRFLKWKVYKDSKELFSKILKVVRKLPKEYRFEIGSQIIRATFSVILNIAEGSGKSTDKELNHYFNIALGSLYEVLASIDVLRDNKLVTEEKFEELFKKIDEISNQLGGFKKIISCRL